MDFLAWDLCVRLVLVLLASSGTWCLEVRKLEVPELVLLGQPAVLSCEVALKGDQLYSLSWLKDGHEFLRARPNHPVLTYPTPGVHLKTSDTNGTLIPLWKTDLESEGDYTCEVTGEAPRFFTSSKQSRLSVIVLPESSPRIEGRKSSYLIGDELDLSCHVGPSYPSANLSWYINGHLASGESRVEDLDGGLKIAVAWLRFKVEERHLIGGDLQMTCTASIFDLYWNSGHEPPPHHHSHLRPSFFSHFSISGVENCAGAPFLILLSLCLNILVQKRLLVI